MTAERKRDQSVARFSSSAASSAWLGSSAVQRSASSSVEDRGSRMEDRISPSSIFDLPSSVVGMSEEITGLFPRAAKLIARRVGRVEALDEEILHVVLTVSHTPGDALVMADHYPRRARQARAGHMIVAAAQMVLVPK